MSDELLNNKILIYLSGIPILLTIAAIVILIFSFIPVQNITTVIIGINFILITVFTIGVHLLALISITTKR